MKSYLSILIILVISSITIKPNSDSIKFTQLESKIKILENNILELRRDQLNYTIEKNLLKDVYQLNYDRINFIITLILGLFGVLGFLGIKNINTIKKEYTNELNEFKTLRSEFEQKVVSFDNLKQKFEIEIEKLTKTNSVQNVKIQILELKEKINKLLKEDELSMALETVTIALSLSPNDVMLLRDKSTIYCRLGNYKSALKSLLSVYEMEPSYQSIVPDLIELYYFCNQISEAEKLIESNPSWDGSKNKMLIKYLETLDAYHNKELKDFKNIILEQIDKSNLEIAESRFDWDFSDAQWFHVHVKYSDKEKILINYIWYLQGEVSGQTLLNSIDSKTN